MHNTAWIGKEIFIPSRLEGNWPAEEGEVIGVKETAEGTFLLVRLSDDRTRSLPPERVVLKCLGRNHREHQAQPSPSAPPAEEPGNPLMRHVLYAFGLMLLGIILLAFLGKAFAEAGEPYYQIEIDISSSGITYAIEPNGRAARWDEVKQTFITQLTLRPLVVGGFKLTLTDDGLSLEPTTLSPTLPSQLPKRDFLLALDGALRAARYTPHSRVKVTGLLEVKFLGPGDIRVYKRFH